MGEEEILFEFLLIWCVIRLVEFNPTAMKIEYQIRKPDYICNSSNKHVKISVVRLPAAFFAGGAYSFLADDK